MSRELVIQLIEKKRAVYQEQHDLETEYAQLHQSHAWLMNEDLADDFPELNDNELAIQGKMLALKLSMFSNQGRIYRAHFFGPRYTRSFFPTLCIMCFVEHHKESPMVKVPVGNDCWDGLLQFECPECKHVLRVHPE